MYKHYLLTIVRKSSTQEIPIRIRLDPEIEDTNLTNGDVVELAYRKNLISYLDRAYVENVIPITEAQYQQSKRKV